MTRTYADGIEDAARVASDLVEQMDLACYDAGLLGDGGGGDVGWWQDYIRTELQRAHEFYQDQVAKPTLSPSPSGIEDAREARFRALFKATWDYCLSYLADEYDQPDFCGIDEKQHDALSAVFHALEDVKDTLCESASSKIGGDHG